MTSLDVGLVVYDELDRHTGGYRYDRKLAAELRGVLEGLAVDRERLAALGRRGLETAEEWPGWSESMERARTFLRERVESHERPDRTIEGGKPRPGGETG